MLVAEGRWEELKILTKLCTQMHDLASRFFKDTKYWQQMLYRYKCLKKNICLKMGIINERMSMEEIVSEQSRKVHFNNSF